jgi:hypothetical protein
MDARRDVAPCRLAPGRLRQRGAVEVKEEGGALNRPPGPYQRDHTARPARTRAAQAVSLLCASCTVTWKASG